MYFKEAPVFSLKKEKPKNITSHKKQELLLNCLLAEMQLIDIVRFLEISENEKKQIQKQIQKQFKENTWLRVLKKYYISPQCNLTSFAHPEVKKQSIIYSKKILDLLKKKYSKEQLYFELIILITQYFSKVSKKITKNYRKEVFPNISNIDKEVLKSFYLGGSKTLLYDKKLNLELYLSNSEEKKLLKRFKSNTSFNTLKKSLYLGFLKEEVDFIAIPSMNKITFVKFDDIVFLKSDGRYTEFCLDGSKSMVSSKNLGSYESLLDSKVFFRIHNSYIVNLSKVVSIDKSGGNYCEMNNGKSLPIAKRRQEILYKTIRLK